MPDDTTLCILEIQLANAMGTHPSLQTVKHHECLSFSRIRIAYRSLAYHGAKDYSAAVPIQGHKRCSSNDKHRSLLSFPSDVVS